MLGWPCSGCGETVALDEARCPTCGTGFLAQLHDSTPTGYPLLESVARRVARSRLAASGMGLGLAVLLLLAWVLLGLVH